MPPRIAQVVVCVGLVGCGFSAKPAGTNNDGPVDAPGPLAGDDAGSDAGGGSGSDAGTASKTCFAMWLDGSVRLTTPAPLRNQADPNATERDPWISSDGLRLYYGYQKNGLSSDIYLAMRPNINAEFDAGMILNNLSPSTSNESRPALTGDERTIVISSDRPGTGSGTFNISMSMRPSTDLPFGSPNQDHMSTVNSTSVNHFDPFLSPDGLRLYYAPLGGGGEQHIFLASRGQTGNDFANFGQVPVINSAGDNDADPSLSLDEKIIVFTSDRSGNNELYYATRADMVQQFNTPKLIPGVNSTDLDGDPMLSADGCTLYFASTRGAGNLYDLYSATVVR